MRSVPLLVLALIPAVAGCAGDPAAPSPDPALKVTSVIVSASATVLPIGFETPLILGAWRGNGERVGSPKVKWSVDRPDLVEVDTAGVVRAIGGQGRVTVTATVDAASGSVSLDVVSLPGRLAVQAGDGLEVIPMDGGTRTSIAADIVGDWGGLGRPAWSPDGTRLAYACTDDQSRNAVCVSRADGGGRARLATSTEAYLFGPAWSPSGASILFTHDGLLFQIAPDGSSAPEQVALPIPAGSQWVAGAQPSPDGSWMAYSSYFDIYDTRTLCIARTGQASAATCSRTGGDPAWSPDGATLAAVVGDGNLVVMAGDEQIVKTLVAAGSPVGIPSVPAWSPDGQWIAFTVYSHDQTSVWLDGVYVMRAQDGANLVRLTDHGHRHADPSWR